MAKKTGKVLLTYPTTARTYWFGDQCLAAMREVAEVVLNPEDRVLAPEELAELGRDCQVFVVDRLTRLNHESFGRLPFLLAAVRGGVDHRHIDVGDAGAAGILVTRVEPAYQAAVSEMALALILDAARGVSHYANAYHSGQVPPPRPGRQIAGATIGIIGYGSIARYLAGILNAMGARVLACDRFAPVTAPATEASLEQLLAESDFVLPMANSNPSSNRLLDACAIGLMQPGAWIINVARGDLIDENALEAALDTGKIAGVAMDVGEAPDQMPSPRLAARPDVIATPHVGGITRESFENHAMQTVAQVRNILGGKVPAGAINLTEAHRFARIISS